MSIELKQWNGQNITPLDDAILYQHFESRSGIITGCEVTSLGGNQIQVATGRGIICGREFAITQETILATLGSNLPGRLLIQIDTSNVSSPISFVTQAANPLPALVQDDINAGGTIYQLPIATYTVSTTQISDLVDVGVRLDSLSNLATSLTLPLTVAQGGTGNTSADTIPVSGSTKFLPSGGVKNAIVGDPVTVSADMTVTPSNMWNILNVNGAVTITLPAADATGFSNNDQFYIRRGSSSTMVTIAAPNGVSVYGAGGNGVDNTKATIALAFDIVTVRRLSATTWTVIGGETNSVFPAVMNFTGNAQNVSVARIGKMLMLNASAATTVTVPGSSSENIPIGSEFLLCRKSAATVTVSPAAGVTILSVDNALTIGDRYGVACLKKTDTDEWILFGDLA